MKLPRSFGDFLAGKIYVCRRTIHVGRQPWVVYASRGISLVLIRISHRDRPWQCFRVSVRNYFWDQATYAQREDFMVEQLRKLQRPQQGAIDKPDACDQELARKFPLVHQHLTSTRYDDAAGRQTSSLTVFGHQGAFRGFLNDRDSGGSLGVTADSLQGLLRLLEAELASDSPAWFWREGGDKHPAKNRGKKA